MKLSKTQQKELTNYSNKLGGLWQELDEACEAYNESTTKDKTVLEGLIVQYNEAMDSAKGWCESIAEEIQEHIDGKSEGWQESDRGSAHQTWLEMWQEVEMEPTDFDQLLDSNGVASVSNVEAANEKLDELTTEPDL